MEALQTGGLSVKAKNIYQNVNLNLGIHTFEHLVVLNRAVDGNLDANYRQNSCTHTMYSSSPWLVIDLQGNYAVTHVKIKNRADCCSK